VVAPALDVKGGQIEAAGARRAEEEVLEAGDDFGVDFLGVVGSEVFEDGVDAVLLDDPGVEEGIGHREGVAEGVSLLSRNWMSLPTMECPKR
jgi:hypothetical protein